MRLVECVRGIRCSDCGGHDNVKAIEFGHYQGIRTSICLCVDCRARLVDIIAPHENTRSACSDCLDRFVCDEEHEFYCKERRKS